MDHRRRDILASFIDAGGDPVQTISGFGGAVGGALAGKLFGDAMDAAAVRTASYIGRHIGYDSGIIGADGRGAIVGARIGKGLNYAGVVMGAAVGMRAEKR